MLTVRIFAGSAQRLAGSCAHPQRIPFTLSGCGYRPHMSRWVYHVPWRMFVGFLHPSTARMYDEL